MPGAPGPAPVTVTLCPPDQTPDWEAPLMACTRQKYVPFARPLTVSCVVVPFVEPCATIGVKLDEVLTCQVYETIPLGSVTADQEIVNGITTLAPLAGAVGVGAGGGAAAAGLAGMPVSTNVSASARPSLFLMVGNHLCSSKAGARTRKGCGPCDVT